MMTNQNQPQEVKIEQPQDIVKARGAARQLAAKLGFSIGDQTRLATAVSELTRNILQYAGQGQCHISDFTSKDFIGVQVIAEDHGPGIPNIEKAMIDGFSTSGGLGAGLPGSRRLMEHFAIESKPGLTRITIALQKRCK